MDSILNIDHSKITQFKITAKSKRNSKKSCHIRMDSQILSTKQSKQQESEKVSIYLYLIMVRCLGPENNPKIIYKEEYTLQAQHP